MADTFDKAKRSQIMAAVRSTGNRATEVKLARIFRDHQIRGWRRHQPVTGKPDFVFPGAKLAIFVDGCFWHGCPRHLRVPQSNRAYWQRKIERNQARDRRTVRELRGAGWQVLRIWEHELKSAARVARRVTKALSARPARVKTRRRLRGAS